jgi:hypothetical protein
VHVCGNGRCVTAVPRVRCCCSCCRCR